MTYAPVYRSVAVPDIHYFLNVIYDERDRVSVEALPLPLPLPLNPSGAAGSRLASALSVRNGKKKIEKYLTHTRTAL